VPAPNAFAVHSMELAGSWRHGRKPNGERVGARESNALQQNERGSALRAAPAFLRREYSSQQSGMNS
jgi:hypothetical protein